MSGKNYLIFNWHSSREAPGISVFRVPTKDDEYSIKTRETTLLQLLLVIPYGGKGNLKTRHFELHYPKKNVICHKQIIPTKLQFSLYWQLVKSIGVLPS